MSNDEQGQGSEAPETAPAALERPGIKPGAAQPPGPALIAGHHGRLGGTSIAALLGEDSFKKTPFDIYNRIVHGASSVSNRYMLRGTAVEPRIRELYVTERAATLEQHPGVVLWREAFAASVDDLRVREGVAGVVDYKSASNSDSSMRKWRDGMLSSYAWQLRLYMAVFQREVADLFVAFGTDREASADEPGAFLIGENQWGAFDVTETRLYTIHREPEPEARLIEAGERFWNEHVIPRVPPPGGVELAAPQRAEVTTLSAAELEALNAFA